MAMEIEAKMRLEDIPALERKLAAAGADRGPLIHEHNTFFDTPQASLRRSDQGLRLRVETRNDRSVPTAIVTHKGPVAHGQLKMRQETQLVVDNPQAAIALLNALGFHSTLSFEKRRQRWTLDDCLVEIDTLPHLGDFVEIEGPTESAVLAMRQKLGLADQALIRTSYISMLADYLEKHNLKQTHIRLADSMR